MKQQSIFGTSHTWTVYIDGASRSNPGKSGAGVYIKKDEEVVVKEGFYLRIKTNNQAEYFGLLLGLFFVKQYANPGDVIRIISDSELLVKQMLGAYRVKNSGLQPLYTLAQQWFILLNPDILHVLRSDNKEADALANKGIDTQKVPPAAFIKELASHGISL